MSANEASLSPPWVGGQAEGSEHPRVGRTHSKGDGEARRQKGSIVGAIHGAPERKGAVVHRHDMNLGRQTSNHRRDTLSARRGMGILQGAWREPGGSSRRSHTGRCGSGFPVVYARPRALGAHGREAPGRRATGPPAAALAGDS